MKSSILRVPYAFVATALGASLIAGCGETQSSSSVFPAPAVRDAAKSANDLYVADVGANAVELFNSSDKKAGEIKDGIGSPVDVFLDEQGRLYVANVDGGNVTEYARGDTGQPSFTYSDGMHDPYSVTADAHGNLFEGDAFGSINEYAQGVNKILAACAVAGTVFGLAVDAKGDVFADYFAKPMGPADIVEYGGGLGACNAKSLATSVAPGGLALDKNGNLLVAEGTKVVVIGPGRANSAAKIGSGFASAVNVRLNKANTQAFVTDNARNTVTVVSYPAGKNGKVFGTANGLNAPRAAVDAPNAVY
jgi:hypothetical protein